MGREAPASGARRVDTDLEHPWLIAAWPGMGGVAQIACTYLIQKLGATRIARVEPRDAHDVHSIQVRDGIVQPPESPGNVFFGWKNPWGGRDLAVFLGEKQPVQGGHGLCADILEVARRLGVERVVTFAAMGTPIHPQADPRVFAVASDEELLEEVRRADVEVLAEGEISGLNGVFLSAAAAAGVEGVCLLGEFPYFASAIPNPKASSAVLRVFSELSGIEIDLEEIDVQAEVVEQRLIEHLTQLQHAARIQLSGGEPPAEGDVPESWPEPDDELAAEDRARIEVLFDQARIDRTRAIELKQELDRLGAFKRYEDRFLDLFKRAE